MIQRMDSQYSDRATQSFAIAKYCMKHSKLLTQFGVHALGIRQDPSAANNKVLALDVRPKPGCGEASGRYTVFGVAMTSMSAYKQNFEMQKIPEAAIFGTGRESELGLFFMMCHGPPGMITSIPLQYTKELLESNEPPPSIESIVRIMDQCKFLSFVAV